MRYIRKVKSRYGIVTPTTYGYQHCVEKTGFNVRAMFAQSYLALPVLNNILHHFFAWTFHHFTFSPILEDDIVRTINYDYDKYFSITAWGKSGGSHYKQVKEKYTKATKGNRIDE